MKTIFIHVGYGKTGTSAIQGALADNSAKLAAQGVIYANRSLAHKSLGPNAFASGDEFKVALRKKDMRETFVVRAAQIFTDLIDRDDVQKVIWSHETLLGQTKIIGAVARRLAGVADVKIIIYMRNHIDLIVSGYQQWGIKHKVGKGRLPTLEEYIRDAERKLNFDKMADEWAAEVGDENLIVRSADAAGDVVPDFARVCGIDIELERPSDRRYVTPSPSIMSLFKVYHDQFDEPKASRPVMELLRRAGVLDRDIHPVDPWPIEMSPEMASRLAEQFAPQNEVLENRYGVVLAEKPKPLKPRPQLRPEETNTDLIAILMMLVMHLNDRITVLEAGRKVARKQKKAMSVVDPDEADEDGDEGGVIVAAPPPAPAPAKRRDRKAARTEKRVGAKASAVAEGSE